MDTHVATIMSWTHMSLQSCHGHTCRYNHVMDTCRYNHVMDTCRYNHVMDTCRYNHVMDTCRYNHVMDTHVATIISWTHMIAATIMSWIISNFMNTHKSCYDHSQKRTTVCAVHSIPNRKIKKGWCPTGVQGSPSE
jgi:hypothetical protein